MTAHDRALYDAMMAADEAWWHALMRKFPRNASEARYDERGESTSELRALKAAKVASDTAWATRPGGIMSQHFRRNPPTAGPAVDAWTLAHVGAGAALGALRVGPVASLVALALFEVAEAGLRATGTGAGLFAPESRTNVAVDLAAGAVGWLAVKAVRR